MTTTSCLNNSKTKTKGNNPNNLNRATPNNRAPSHLRNPNNSKCHQYSRSPNKWTWWACTIHHPSSSKTHHSSRVRRHCISSSLSRGTTTSVGWVRCLNRIKAITSSNRDSSRCSLISSVGNKIWCSRKGCINNKGDFRLISSRSKIPWWAWVICSKGRRWAWVIWVVWEICSRGLSSRWEDLDSPSNSLNNSHSNHNHKTMLLWMICLTDYCWCKNGDRAQ